MEIQNKFREPVNLCLLHPNTVITPVNSEIIRKDTIGVDKDRDSTQAEGLVKPRREISDSANTNRIIGIENVVNKFKARRTKSLARSIRPLIRLDTPHE